MDSKKAKAYILDTTGIHGGRTLGKWLRSMRTGCALISFIILFALYSAVFVANDANSILITVFLIAILSNAITVVIAFKRNKRIAHTYRGANNASSAPRRFPYNAALGALAGVGGMFLVRSLNFSEDVMLMVSTVGIVPILLLLTYTASTAQYKLYLLRKYCPEINDLKAN